MLLSGGVHRLHRLESLSTPMTVRRPALASRGGSTSVCWAEVVMHARPVSVNSSANVRYTAVRLPTTRLCVVAEHLSKSRTAYQSP